MWLNIVQIVTSILLIISILLQQRGEGLSTVFGGEGVYHTRRGMEKSLFSATVVLAAIFLITAFLNIVLK